MKDKNIRVNFRQPVELKRAAEAKAKRLGISVAELIRHAIRRQFADVNIRCAHPVTLTEFRQMLQEAKAKRRAIKRQAKGSEQ